jgi:hypothetical protein
MGLEQVVCMKREEKCAQNFNQNSTNKKEREIGGCTLRGKYVIKINAILIEREGGDWIELNKYRAH